MYQAAMVKQSITVPMYTYTHRLDAHYIVPYTSQKPLVQTWMDAASGPNELPMGTNAIVAIMSHTGFFLGTSFTRVGTTRRTVSSSTRRPLTAACFGARMKHIRVYPQVLFRVPRQRACGGRRQG